LIILILFTGFRCQLEFINLHKILKKIIFLRNIFYHHFLLSHKLNPINEMEDLRLTKQYRLNKSITVPIDILTVYLILL
ncbi:hypothetical protein L9F63_011251, partial [Diploptera punctata]